MCVWQPRKFPFKPVLDIRRKGEEAVSTPEMPLFFRTIMLGKVWMSRRPVSRPMIRVLPQA